MGVDDFLNNAKINIEKYGFFFWFILFGFVDIVFSIIHNEKYIELGLIFCAFGAAGYVYAELLDKISVNLYDSKPPLLFHIINTILKLTLFFFLFWGVNHEYRFFGS